MAWAQSETRREKHFLRKSAKLSCLLRNEMLLTKGGETNEHPSSPRNEMLKTRGGKTNELRNEMLLTKGGETNEQPSSRLLMP